MDNNVMDFEAKYRQFLDSSEPFSLIQQKDWAVYSEYSQTYPYLHGLPDPARRDSIAVAYGPDPLQRLDIHQLSEDSNKKRPVIFFIHGGGWTLEDKSNTRFFAPLLIKLGYTVVSMNYRLVPSVTHPSQVEDCALALKWVMDNIGNYDSDADNIAIFGYSAGAHLAALLVTAKKWQYKYGIDMNRIKCCIGMSGVYDFTLPENYWLKMLKDFITPMLGQSDKLDCSPCHYVAGDEVPFLLLHGSDDWLVPRSNTIHMYQKLKKERCKDVQFEMVKGYRHCDMFWGFDKPGHKPAEIIIKYLSKKMPVCKGENSKG